MNRPTRDAASSRSTVDGDTEGAKVLDWMGRAACRGRDAHLFFGDAGQQQKAVRRHCGRCPVTEQCLRFALDNDEEQGMWGGLTPTQRRRLARRRAVA